MSSRIFIPIALLICVIEGILAFGVGYRPAVPGFWCSVVVAGIVTVVEVLRPFKF